VRQRALAARAKRDEERRVTEPHPIEAHDDEPASFEIDEASLDRRVAETRMAAQPVRQADPLPARPRVGAEPESRQQARTGLFTINKLIHRVAGHGAQDDRAGQAERRDPPTYDEGGDIPAFLRRQAN
jgi:hypothetical protein